jgi:hypothetical protein
MSAKTAWKWRVLWLLATSCSLYAVFLIASRHYRAELKAITSEAKHQTALMEQALITVKNGLRNYG